MKTTIKIIAAIVLVVAGWYASSLFKERGSEKSNPIAEIKKKEIQTEASEIKKEVDKNGLQHTIYKMVKEIDQSAVDAVKADLLDTAEALGITRDKLKQVIVVNANLAIENQELKKKVTESGATYSHTDSHFNLSVRIPNDTLIKPTFDAGYDADLITTQYNKSKWLFWNNQLIDIYSNDKRFTIKGARTLTIKPAPPKVAASIDLVSEYNKFIGASGGAEARLRLGRFTINTGYQFYPNYNQWDLNYGLRYRLIGNN